MAKEITKVLGQAQIAVINTEETIYTVPENRQAVISSIIVTDSGIGNILYKIAVVPDGSNVATPSPAKHYIRWQKSIAKDTSDDIKVGITMDEFDEIRITADDTDIVFSVFGVELGQEE